MHCHAIMSIYPKSTVAIYRVFVTECTFELNKDKKEFITHENVNKCSNQFKQ